METLKAGSRGENVRTAQALLNVWAQDVGGVAIAEDSAFGTATKAAVMAFQTAKGLAVDGIIGTQTWAALQGLPDAEPDNTDEGEAEPDGEAETDKFDRVKGAIKAAQDALKTAQSVIAAMEAKS